MARFKEIMGLEGFSQGSMCCDDPHVVPNLYLFQNYFEEYRIIYTHINKSIQLLPIKFKKRTEKTPLKYHKVVHAIFIYFLVHKSGSC